MWFVLFGILKSKVSPLPKNIENLSIYILLANTNVMNASYKYIINNHVRMYYNKYTVQI